LGEYIALYAGVLTGQLVCRKRRAELMDSAAGGMMAAVRFDREQLEQQIQQTPMWCWLMTTVLLRL